MDRAQPQIDLRSHPVLYVDDEQDNLDAFRFSFRREFELGTAVGGAAALELLDELDPAVLVADQRMPGMSGIEFLRKARELRPDAVGLILTAYTDIEVLIEALNSNLVYRYITKPWDSKEMRVVLRQAIERHVLFRENRRLVARLEELNCYLSGEIRERFRPRAIVGASRVLHRVLDSVRSVASTNSTVMIRGESGSGKELIAQAIHENSRRAGGPFIRVACASLSTGVLESELFGHEKGAFTGAHQRKLGRFELAEHGTLFLDEVGDLPPETQVKLLRVIQEREFERVGGTRTLGLDVRLVAATHRNLEALIAQGRFREDLYFRLNVFPIFLPPLRERREDIPMLTEHFLKRFNQVMAREIRGFSPEARERLMAYPWPGNVRELENVIERAVILANGPMIGAELIQLSAPLVQAVSHRAEIERRAAAFSEQGPDPCGEVQGPTLPGSNPGPVAERPPSSAEQSWEGSGWEKIGQPLTPAAGSLSDQLEDLERRELLRSLQQAGGSKAGAARILGINRSTLYYRLKKHGLADEE